MARIHGRERELNRVADAMGGSPLPAVGDVVTLADPGVAEELKQKYEED